DLPQGFAKLREALKPMLGGDLSHVVYTSYANPALSNGGAPCPGGRAGFDIHPSFNANPQRLANVVSFVENEFLPALKALATCQSGVLCRDPAADRLRRPRLLRPRRGISGVRPPVLFAERRELRSRHRQFRQPAAPVRPQPWRLPRLSAADALDPRRQRQLFRGNDLSAGAAFV